MGSSRCTSREEVLNLGCPQGIGASCQRQGMVVLQAARVAGEIFVWSELQRVHEHADQHPAALLPSTTNQSRVALVQGPHGGNQMQRAGIADLQPLPQFR